MRKPEASDEEGRQGQPRRLTLALSFGFAAGALMARRPAAALTALATGVLACLSASGGRHVVSEEEDERPAESSQPQTDPAMEAIQQSPAPDSRPVTEPDASGEIEPLPEIVLLPEPEAVDTADDLLSLSLPEVDGETAPEAAKNPGNTGSPVLAASEASQDRSPMPSEFELRATVSAKKRSWLGWFR